MAGEEQQAGSQELQQEDIVKNPITVRHVHEQSPAKPTVDLKVEKNTKGYNWEVIVRGYEDPVEAMRILQEREAIMRETYGIPVL